MSTLNEDQIKILNSLIETTIDSAHGYSEASKDTKNPLFRTLFEQRSQERHGLTGRLQAMVRELGGEPVSDGTVLASAHRVFLNLKNMVTGSDLSIVNEVESAEDHIKAKFEEAMKDEHLSTPVRVLVNNVYAPILAGHDQMRKLQRDLESVAAQ